MNLYVSYLSSHGFLNLGCILFSFCNFNMTTYPFVTSIAHINGSESLNQLAQKFGQRTFAFDGALEKTTFEELNVFAHQVARVLIEKGVKSAEPVASLRPNHLDVIWIT